MQSAKIYRAPEGFIIIVPYKIHAVPIFGFILYNRAIVYKRQNFLKVVVQVIIMDQ